MYVAGHDHPWSHQASLQNTHRQSYWDQSKQSQRHSELTPQQITSPSFDFPARNNHRHNFKVRWRMGWWHQWSVPADPHSYPLTANPDLHPRWNQLSVESKERVEVHRWASKNIPWNPSVLLSYDHLRSELLLKMLVWNTVLSLKDCACLSVLDFPRAMHLRANQNLRKNRWCGRDKTHTLVSHKSYWGVRTEGTANRAENLFDLLVWRKTQEERVQADATSCVGVLIWLGQLWNSGDEPTAAHQHHAKVHRRHRWREHPPVRHPMLEVSGQHHAHLDPQPHLVLHA